MSSLKGFGEYLFSQLGLYAAGEPSLMPPIPARPSALADAYEDPTHRCTRYAGHDGPCNGLPCDTVLAKMDKAKYVCGGCGKYGDCSCVHPLVEDAANPDGTNKPTRWRLTVRAMDALGPNDHLLSNEPLATMPEHALSDIWNLLGPECEPTDWAGIRNAVGELVRNHARMRRECIEALQRPSKASEMIQRLKDGL